MWRHAMSLRSRRRKRSGSARPTGYRRACVLRRMSRMSPMKLRSSGFVMRLLRSRTPTRSISCSTMQESAAAATVILDGVKTNRWRILVGEDALQIDDLVRQSPERAYDVDFFESFATEVGWRIR